MEYFGLAVATILFVVIWFVAVYPVWNVWASRKEGEADLENAMKAQRIQLAEANARLEAAEINKKAAIIEAEAVSAQIEKIGTKLTSHSLYLRWQWIKMMEDRGGETIYVPTEANLPILEATRPVARALDSLAHKDDESCDDVLKVMEE